MLSKILLVYFSLFLSFSQEPNNIETEAPQTQVVNKVEDRLIEDRLQDIISASGWFPQVSLKVSQGLVFLEGTIEDQEKEKWLIRLIENTEGVVALLNNAEVKSPKDLSLEPARSELQIIYKSLAKFLPYIISSLLIFVLFTLLSLLVKKTTLYIFAKRKSNLLISRSIANLSFFLVLALGLYLALRSSGLSGLAFTVLGGTGVLGIGIGLALKNTIENYISGIMISVRQIFRQGELVEILGHTGVVQSVTTRSTTIMDFEGNNVIFPNSEVLNAVVKNLTRNPNMRTDFTVGIGYEDSISNARLVIKETLSSLSPQVLMEPESFVSVEGLGSATVNLKVYFWFDAKNYSLLKIRSFVIEKVKEALIEANISMPDDAREVIFTSPLEIINDRNLAERRARDKVSLQDKISKSAEATEVNPDLSTETIELKKQVEESGQVETGNNLL